MIKGLFSLLLKANCPLCDRPADEEICCHCQRQLQSCSQPNSAQFRAAGDLPIFCWGIYGGKMKQAIAALKYENRPEIAEILGFWLAEAWLNSPAGKKHKNLRVVPIPLHSKRLQERGFNQAEAIAKSFCQIAGCKLYAQGLKRVRDTEKMFGLDPTERQKNVERAFIIGKDLRECRSNSPLLLIDDIYTTGATARAAARALQIHQIKLVGIAALAASQA